MTDASPLAGLLEARALESAARELALYKTIPELVHEVWRDCIPPARAAIRAYLSDEAWVEKLARALSNAEYDEAAEAELSAGEPNYDRYRIRAVLSALLEGLQL